MPILGGGGCKTQPWGPKGNKPVLCLKCYIFFWLSHTHTHTPLTLTLSLSLVTSPQTTTCCFNKEVALDSLQLYPSTSPHLMRTQPITSWLGPGQQRQQKKQKSTWRSTACCRRWTHTRRYRTNLSGNCLPMRPMLTTVPMRPFTVSWDCFFNSFCTMPVVV